jgi:hypothetical protein
MPNTDWIIWLVAQAIHAGSDCEVKKSRIARPWPQREQQKAHHSSKKDEHAQRTTGESARSTSIGMALFTSLLLRSPLMINV